MPSSNCLTDEVLIALSEGQLRDVLLAQAHRHAADCEDCRLLLVELTRGGIPEARDAITNTISVQGTGEEGPSGTWTPPSEFDEFRLERLLGRGGMGMVYLAYDTSLDRHVAVKFIADSQPKPWVQRYFENEARVLARMQHPNVVSVLRVGRVGEHPYIVSEYVTGSSLAELPMPIPWRQALGLGLGLVRGLAEAHRQGVLHRDLKPSNVLVTETGEVKLLDFGLAEPIDEGADAALSSSRIIAGTLPYMAPELLAGTPATPRSDIYALGLVLRELCTGVPPRAASSTEPEPPPPARAPIIDPDFAAIIQQCCAPAPRDRFGSAEALSEALERLAQNTAPMPLPAGNPYRGLEPFEAEHRALFFGRDADIRAVLERLRYQSLVLVAGDSGAGKSSLCRAGVLPQVAAGVLEEGREMATVTLWPGRRPLDALAAVLAPILGRKEEELVRLLADTPAWLGRALREAHQFRQGLLLFVDQLEELITISETAQAEHFARIIGELSLPAAGVRVLMTVRGDFLTRVCALPGLGEEAERGLYILRPLSAEGVREAIVGPARRRGVVFESEELVQTLVASTARGAGSLPLLQFALAELWGRRDAARGCITRTELEEMGGVAGALSRHADRVLERMSSAAHGAARSLLLRLVTAEGTRVERGEKELVEGSEGSAHAALRTLVEGRLLHTRTVGGEARWEIAHDSLIESWGTLRDWLDDDIGHRVVRKRLEEASTEWERLGMTREVLWVQRQLDETRSLEPSTLGPRERAFLAASHRRRVRQQWGRWLAALAVALAISAAYGGLRLQAYLEDSRFVTARQALAREALAEGRALARQAEEGREAALALFDAGGSGGQRDAADQRWIEVLGLRDQASAAYARASRELERALDRDRGDSGTRGLLAEVTYERILLDERFYQLHGRDERVQSLEQMAESSSEAREWLRLLQAPAELELVTEPPGASVTIQRYSSASRMLRLEPVPGVGTLGPSPLARVSMPEGSYHLRITHPGRVPVEVPLLLMRGTHEQVHVMLPTYVPDGYVYIPPGCFLLGSSDPEVLRSALSSPPMHRFCLTEGYLIGRTEVTFSDWLAYLDSLPQGDPARRILEQPNFGATGGRAVTLRRSSSGGWSFSFHISPGVSFTAADGKPFRYPARTQRNTADWRQFPLSGVSSVDLEPYLNWLDRTGRLPGARLCTENEWEYAARGADGRRFPQGEVLPPDGANIDTTYGRQLMNYGPDMVGSHPASTSPFGLVDMVGNIYEITRSVTPELGRVVYRGGSWYQDLHTANPSNHQAGDPTQRDVVLGVRVCAPAPTR
jgi:formylglycine-generating enzyme required for sulfatase activity/predicted Ser/Thr protein kinase